MTAELTRVDKLKDEFLAKTSHELRTPIAGLVGIVESLLKGSAGPLSKLVKKNMTVLVHSGKRLAHLINDIQDFSRLKHGDVTLNRKPLLLSMPAGSVFAVLTPTAQTAGIRLHKELPDDLPSVYGDEERIEQILINLIGNGIKFTSQGDVRLGAKRRSKFIEVSVTDTGSGIPQHRLDDVFESFEQVKENDSGVIARGTGLGLSVTRQLVELQGGEIGVESELGRGSRFWFTLPVSDDPSMPEQSDRSPGLNGSPGISGDDRLMTAGDDFVPLPIDSAPPSGDNACILAVDDEPINLQVIVNQLTPHGYNVETAGRGDRVLALLSEESSPDLLLLDVMMPEPNGYEVCKWVRTKFSAAELPILLLTAKTRIEDLVAGFAAGASDYLTKPFSRDELLARVRAHLAVRDALRATQRMCAMELELEQQRQSEHEARLASERAQLEMLRYQLNPHFLFNALNTIQDAIVHKTAGIAGEMVADLAELFHLSLATGGRDRHLLTAEIELIRRYLRIAEARWEEGLLTEITVAPNIEDCLVPAFVLQPLVENAIKYGEPGKDGVLKIRVAVSVRLKGDEASQPDVDTLVFRISNTGSWPETTSIDTKNHDGSPPSNSENGTPSTGIGLFNLEQRLDKLYPGRYEMNKTAANGWVHIEITLPKEEP